MEHRVLRRIRAAIRGGTCDVTAHAAEEMAEDDRELVDVEAAILNGDIVRRQTDDPRGARYAVRGHATDGLTPVYVVGRIVSTGRFLIVTVYAVTGQT
jgi:hypothetical protein